ncbi:MAG: hypothetical protein F6K31_15430 [Symploca sp. SIO2G7]|nr:hypothetical protein [Symploca sp. SIO2G7]
MLLVIGYLSFVIGHLSLVICHWSFVIGHWSLVICHLSLVIGSGGDKLKACAFCQPPYIVFRH